LIIKFRAVGRAWRPSRRIHVPLQEKGNEAVKEQGMAFMVVRGEYDEYRVLHVFEEREGDNGADMWALQYNAEVAWVSEGEKARVEEVGLTLAGEVPPPIRPIVVDGEVRMAGRGDGPRLIG
jgi:hypothetical protein